MYQHYVADHLNLGVNGDFYVYCAMLMALSCFVYTVIEKRGRQFIFWLDKTAMRVQASRRSSTSSSTAD